MSVYPSVSKSVFRSVLKSLRLPPAMVGETIFPLDDPTGDPISGSYFVNSNGRYIANSNNDWLIQPDSFSPTDISNLVLWLRADDVGLSDGATVTTWTSREGSSFAFTQATAGKKPTYVASSSINSQPAVSFDGGDLLAVASVVTVANVGTIAVICRRSGDSNYQTLYGQCQGNGTSYMPFYHRYSSAKLAFESNATGNAQASQTTSTGSNDFCIVQSSGTAITMRKNGVDQTVTDGSSGAWFADNNFANSSIGGLKYDVANDVFFFTGLIAEVLIYDRKITSQEIADLESYVLARYAI